MGSDLIDSEDAVWHEPGGLVLRAERPPTALRWNGERFVPLAVETSSTPGSRQVDLVSLRGAGDPPSRYGAFMGRSSAPTDAQIDQFAAVWRIASFAESDSLGEGDRVELVIEWEGDVAQLRLDGVPIRDRFWDGLSWRIDVTGIDPSAELTLHIVPITDESAIDLDAVARARVLQNRRLCAVHTVTRVVSTRWTETPPLTAD